MNTASLVFKYCALAEVQRKRPNNDHMFAAHTLIAKMLGCHVTHNQHPTLAHLTGRKSAYRRRYIHGSTDGWDSVLDHYNFIARKGRGLAGVITAPYPPIDVRRFCILNNLLCVEIPGCWWSAKTYVILPNDELGLADAAVIAAAFGLEVA